MEVVCHLRGEDSEVLLVRMGTDGVGASVVRMGEPLRGTPPSRLVKRWHWHLQVPSFQSLDGEMAAAEEFLGYVIHSFLCRIILFLC